MVGRQLAIGFDQQFFHGFLANLGVFDLAGQVADQRLGGRSSERSNRGTRVLQEHGNVLVC